MLEESRLVWQPCPHWIPQPSIELMDVPKMLSCIVDDVSLVLSSRLYVALTSSDVCVNEPWEWLHHQLGLILEHDLQESILHSIQNKSQTLLKWIQRLHPLSPLTPLPCAPSPFHSLFSTFYHILEWIQTCPIPNAETVLQLYSCLGRLFALIGFHSEFKTMESIECLLFCIQTCSTHMQQCQIQKACPILIFLDVYFHMRLHRSIDPSLTTLLNIHQQDDFLPSILFPWLKAWIHYTQNEPSILIETCLALLENPSIQSVLYDKQQQDSLAHSVAFMTLILCAWGYQQQKKPHLALLYVHQSMDILSANTAVYAFRWIPALMAISLLDEPRAYTMRLHVIDDLLSSQEGYSTLPVGAIVLDLFKAKPISSQQEHLLTVIDYCDQICHFIEKGTWMMQQDVITVYYALFQSLSEYSYLLQEPSSSLSNTPNHNKLLQVLDTLAQKTQLMVDTSQQTDFLSLYYSADALNRYARVAHVHLTPSMEPSQLEAFLVENLDRLNKSIHRFELVLKLMNALQNGESDTLSFIQQHPLLNVYKQDSSLGQSLIQYSLNNLSIAYYHAGNIEAALWKLSQAVLLYPDDRLIVWNYCTLLQLQGRRKDAQSEWKRLSPFTLPCSIPLDEQLFQSVKCF